MPGIETVSLNFGHVLEYSHVKGRAVRFRVATMEERDEPMCWVRAMHNPFVPSCKL